MSDVDSDSSFSSENLTPHQPQNSSSDETPILEQIKKSLKISENEFLESEIADLKEFFTVELEEHDPLESLSSSSDIVSYERFWVKVGLPVTLRKISKDGKETINERKADISFRIKLKNGKFVVKIEKPQEETDEEERVCKEEEAEEESKIMVKGQKEVIGSEAESEANESNPVIEEDEVPYEIEDFEIVEKLECEENQVLESILKELIELEDLALLNLIEEFYIRLESTNYPHKDIICRDYYYPIFDNRHWGRPKTAHSSSTSKSSSGPLSSYSHGNSSSLDLPGGTLSYRARALYDFQALMQGELSFQENEVLVVLANLGNGWLTARRSSDTNSGPALETDDNMTGLIPENYIERL